MKTNRCFGILLGFAFLFSCQKELEFKGEGKDPLLVVNAIEQNDSTFKVYLERTTFFLSNEGEESKYIETGAIMKVTNVSTGEVFTMNQSTYDNVYEFPFVTAPGTRYKIEVSHAEYPSVSSEITTVPNVTLTSVDTSGFSKDGSLHKRAVLKWNDPAGENYYMLRLFYADPLYDYFYQMTFQSNDEVTSGQGADPLSSDKPTFDDLLFTDELFDGEQKQLEIEFMTYKGMTPAEDPIYTYRLITMNKETYLYYRSVLMGQEDSPFIEPVKVYSNIEGGFGIFGSLNNSQIVK
ncbi:MAG: hypothetical protein K0R65_534 [Crocinitomicaceae bacterium]|jgi:hypothetical protein|nr:hypothetical protein [Crocinitomicaceae bacterium]